MALLSGPDGKSASCRVFSRLTAAATRYVVNGCDSLAAFPDAQFVSYACTTFYRAVLLLLAPCSFMPAVESPTELKQLPLLALLAFAARCARRVADLVRLDAEHPEAIQC